MKIAIIGAGHIGGTLGVLLVKAGHTVLFGSRNPGALRDLVTEVGSTASVHPVGEAVLAAEAVIFAGPYGAWPDLAKEQGGALRSKTVMDAANPYAERDGAIVAAVELTGRGSAAYTASLLPGAHVVKVFNTMYWLDLRDKSNQPGERLAMPLVGDDKESVKLAMQLVRDMGFDPVLVGGLERGRDLDPGSPIYAKSFTAAVVRRELKLNV